MSLERHFLVAYLHQRGAGRSDPVPDSQQTFAAHVRDVRAVVDYLEQRYEKSATHIVRHSWGGILALLYLERYPDGAASVTLIAAAANFGAYIEDSYDETLDWAIANQVSDALEALDRIDWPIDSWQEGIAVSRWASEANGGIAAHFGLSELASIVWSSWISYTDWRERADAIARAMSNEILGLDLDEAVSTLDGPALFVCVSQDTIVPCRSMRRDYQRYAARRDSSR